MAVNTLLLDFSVRPDDLKSEQDMLALSTKVENVLRDHLVTLKMINSLPVEGGIVKLYTSDGGVVTSLRIFGNGLVILNIEYFRGEGQEPVLDYKVINALIGRVELYETVQYSVVSAIKTFRTKITGHPELFSFKTIPSPAKGGALRRVPHEFRFFFHVYRLFILLECTHLVLECRCFVLFCFVYLVLLLLMM